MAGLIRECSGIVCLCLTERQVTRLALPMMVSDNTSRHQTRFTASIEARNGVTTGVSAVDRVINVKPPSPPTRPIWLGRVMFSLRAMEGGVLRRRGHTEGTVDLMQLAGLKPAGVLCELTNPDGTMARPPEMLAFVECHSMPVLTIDDIVQYRLALERCAEASCA